MNISSIEAKALTIDQIRTDLPLPQDNLERLLTIPTIKNFCGPAGPTGCYSPFVSFSTIRITGATGTTSELSLTEKELEKQISWRDYMMFK